MAPRGQPHRVATTLALFTLAAACRDEAPAVLPSVQPLAWMKDFPRLRDALETLRRERGGRPVLPTAEQAAGHGRLLVQAMVADLRGQTTPMSSPQLSERSLPAEVIRAFNALLVKREKQCLFISPDTMDYQIVQLRSAGALDPSRYQFGPFGLLEQAVPVYEITSVVYDLADRNECFLAGSFVDLGREPPIIVVEPRVFAELASARLSVAEARQKTIDNEAGHARFREYLARYYPTLAQPDAKLHGPVLRLHEAFSFYSNLCNTPSGPLLLDIMEKVTQTFEGSLRQQYGLLADSLLRGLNTYLGRPEQTPRGDLAVRLREYQTLLAPMVADSRNLEPLRKHLTHAIEDRILQTLAELAGGPK